MFDVLSDVIDTSSRPREMGLTISLLILKLFEFYKCHCVGMTTGFPMVYRNTFDKVVCASIMPIYTLQSRI